MSLQNQKRLFNLPEQPIYLNGAYMSPQLKSVEQIGIENLKRKSQPASITPADFFSEKEILRQRFADLIHDNDPQRIAIIPSVSFAVGTAMKNIPFQKGDEIVVLNEQFPSNYYTWKQLEFEKEAKIVTIHPPELGPQRAAQWNEAILHAISPKTKCVALPHVHWADGTKFNLVAIRKRCDEVGAYLIIDGTQSVGAMPFSVRDIRPDALICGGYKWLMGPYGLGVAYFGERFDHGLPLDNNWMNHEGAEDFSNLVNYNHNFKPKAARYDIGESSNFILVPMLAEGIKQLLEWTPEAIQAYCKSISNKALTELVNYGYHVEDENYRGHHLFGIYLRKGQALEPMKQKIREAGILVSYRGNSIRVSLNVYNSEAEVEKLISCFI